MAGISNDLASQLGRYYQKRNANADSSQTADDAFKKLKLKHQALLSGKSDAKETSGNTVSETDTAEISSQNETAEMNPIERRKKELQSIMDKLNAEEAQKNFGRNSLQNSSADANGILTAESSDINDLSQYAGTLGFINDMPLFGEFKTSLMDAFKSMDSADQGIINAQYELNYTSMQYVMDASGTSQMKETNFSLKLDLNYIKAAAGGSTGTQIAEAIDKSTDFASMLQNLQKIGKTGQSETGKGIDVEQLQASMKDYFSPASTADRILDFATSFYELSDAFKKHGDTEEGRTEFADLMRNAIQKGFDQALGSLGKLDKTTQDSVDKTHDLVWKGIDDFITNGLNKNKKEQGIYNSLEQFAMSFQMSYSEKTISYTSSGEAYSQPQSSLLNTQA